VSPPDTAQDVALAPDTPPEPGARLRVLFVGNSYTYVNDLPALVRASLQASGRVTSVEVAQVATGGATLRDHAQGEAVGRIREGGWTHVVLQGQSVEPCSNPTGFATYAQRLAMEVSTVGAVPVFYATWARRAGDPVYAQPWSGGDPAGMTACLQGAYRDAAMRSRGLLAPVGEAWRASLAIRPGLTLHQDDGSHPVLAGSYLAASVFVRVLVGAPREGARPFVPDGLGADDAAALRAVAAAAVPTP
jgi:hypothetical protein